MKISHLVFGALGVGVVVACLEKLRDARASQHRVGVDMACRPPHDVGTVSHFGFQKTCEECGNCDSPDWASFRRWSAETAWLRDAYTHPSCQPPMDPGPGGSFVFAQKTCAECGNCDSPAWRSFHEWSRAEEAAMLGNMRQAAMLASLRNPLR